MCLLTKMSSINYIIDFSKIKNLNPNDDTIFKLLSKYNVDIDNCLEFVKNYIHDNYTPLRKSDNKQAINAILLFNVNVIKKIIKKLEEQKDYFHINNNLKTSDNLSETIYITPSGVIRLMENDCKKFQSKNLKELYYKIIILCLYEINMKENVNDRIVN